MYDNLPEEDNRKVVFCCEHCGEPIRYGDPYSSIYGKIYCDDCTLEGVLKSIEGQYKVIPEHEEEVELAIGECPYCHTPIFNWEGRVEYEGDTFHEDCFQEAIVEIERPSIYYYVADDLSNVSDY